MLLLNHIYRPLTNLIVEDNPRHHVDYLVVVPSGSSAQVYQNLFRKIVERLGGKPDNDLHFLAVNENESFSFGSLVRSNPFKVLILCGLSARSVGLQAGLGLHFPVRLAGRYILRTEAPESLEKASVDVKTAFWNCLRNIPQTSEV